MTTRSFPLTTIPFAADGVTQQAQIQQAQPQGPPQQQPATGAGQPDAGAPAAGGGPSGSEGGGIGPTRGAPNPTLDQGAAKTAPFGGYSLVPVDYQPNFDGYSLVPVDYDPFAADGVTQQAQAQQPPAPTQPAQPQPQTQPQQPATGAGQPGVNGLATGNSPSGSGGGAGVNNARSDPNNPTWAQAWSPEPAAFDGYSNSTPRQPLTDDQLALIRQKIVEAAQKQIGSTDWDANVEKGNFGAGKNKCNLFVHEMLTDAGASPGFPNGHWYWKQYPPGAGQWADPSYAIPGWRVLGPDEWPQPGDVAAQPRDYSDATGHVVIVGPNNTFIGVGPPEHPEIPGYPEKIEIVPKKDIIVDPPAKGPLLYRRYIGR
jgi:hypothetical protein